MERIVHTYDKEERDLKSLSKETASKILDKFPELMNINEVSDALRCTTKTVRRLIDANKLECTRVGRSIFVSRESVSDYLCNPVKKYEYARGR